MIDQHQDSSPKNTKILIQEDVYSSISIVMLCTIAKIWKQLKCLEIDEHM